MNELIFVASELYLLSKINKATRWEVHLYTLLTSSFNDEANRSELVKLGENRHVPRRRRTFVYTHGVPYYQQKSFKTQNKLFNGFPSNVGEKNFMRLYYASNCEDKKTLLFYFCRRISKSPPLLL
jgi:hypothetical protein